MTHWSMLGYCVYKRFFSLFIYQQTNGHKSPVEEIAPPTETLNGNGNHKEEVNEVSFFFIKWLIS